MADRLCDPDCGTHRAALRRLLPDGLTLLAGGTELARNNDVSYVFRQRSDFLYLAGVPEPGYLLLLDPRRGRDTLFIPRVGADHRVWLGNVPGPAETRRRYRISDVRYVDELPAVLDRSRRGYRLCYPDRAAWRLHRRRLRGLSRRPLRLFDALQTLRARKTPGELECLRLANDISAEGHRACMAAARPGMRECELQAEFEAVCRRRGLRHQGYPPIVAAGRNGAVLHYHHNDDVLRRGELILIDAGGECGGYAADITRTFPVGGRFTRRQRDIYSIVLEAQNACIDRARAGILSGDLHFLSMRIIAEGLKSLRLLRGPTDELISGGAVRLFYPHGIGHMLGLDVHDALGGRARQVPMPPNMRVRFNARLEPGFVVTVEPGIYFNDALLGDPQRRRRYRKVVDFTRVDAFMDFGGVRIEDDVVVQSEGPPVNLTTVPKTLRDVEAACGR